MAVSERDRREFYDSAREVFGESGADYLMSVLPPVGWADVATKHDLSQLELRLEAEFDAKLNALFARLVITQVGSMIGLAALVLAATAI